MQPVLEEKQQNKKLIVSNERQVVQPSPLKAQPSSIKKCKTIGAKKREKKIEHVCKQLEEILCNEKQTSPIARLQTD
tara:strand:- start:219 stop:449 length:231 start_codon:yes stop_codon:yes gene_type:complete